MEFVPGEPITTYCDLHRLKTRDRLQLFLQVCDAVQHAHRKGIIHRDLKPSNILIMLNEGAPLAKVIDFGVAKAVDHRLTERTLFTEHGQLIGTPEYMSPEQATMSGLDIDTRTDVYSMGVLLYELLSGALPFDPRTLRGAAYAEIQRVIREIDPPKPSTRLSSLGNDSGKVAQMRSSDATALLRQLRGDLDWIVMRAMEKERTRRYGSASELADDIRRHLENRPVQAGPPGAGYVMGKFIRRHRPAVAAAALVLLTLLVGLTGTTWQAVRATRAEKVAQEQRRRAEARFGQVRELVNKFLFDFDRAIRDLPGATAPRAMLVQTALKYLDNLSSDPLADDQLLRELAMAYTKIGDTQGGSPTSSLGDPDGALASYAKAEAIFRQLASRHPDDPNIAHDLLSPKYAIANIKLNRGQTAAALADYQAYTAAMEELARKFPTNRKLQIDTALGKSQIGEILESMGRHDEAFELLRRATELREQILRADPSNVDAQIALAGEYMGTGEVYYNRRDFTAAAQWHQKALDLLEPALAGNPNHAPLVRQTALTLERLGDSTRDQEKAKALDYYQRSMALRAKSAQLDPNDVIAQRDLSIAHDRIARMLRLDGKTMQAIDEYRAAESIRQQLLDKDPRSATAQRDLAATRLFIGQCYSNLKRYEDALPEYEQFAATMRALLSEDPSKPGMAMDLAVAVMHIGETHLSIADAASEKATQIQHIRAARASFEEGRQVCAALKAKGKLTPGDENAVEQFAGAVEKCDKELAHLTGASALPSTQASTLPSTRPAG
jgi:tetratricopeptide (TPR) repeat protein